MRIISTLIILVLSCTVWAAGPLPDEPHIYVEGSASIEVVPDTITFTVSINKAADDMGTAKTDVDTRSKTLIKTCRELGLSDESISTTTLNVRPYYEYIDGNRVPKGTMVSRQIDITVNNLDLYPAVMLALVEANISETIETRLSVSNELEITDQALIEAMADAKKRAERLAASQGKRLGNPFSISEFATRAEERYMLTVSRRVEGQSSRLFPAIASYDSMAVNEPFEPGVMVARAEVYVVYLLR